jgi:pyrimidine-specific ribonucleoside hydrolase
VHPNRSLPLFVLFSVVLFCLFILAGCVSTPVQPAALPTPTQQPAPNKLPVIFDDNGSPDGTAALLYLLSDPTASVQAVTISHGEAHPQVYIQHMGRMLEDLGITGMPLGAGQESALNPGEDFPDWLRQSSDHFWGLPVPNAAKTYPTQDTARLMVSLLHQAPAPLAVFISGSNTDLAQALRLDPGIREHISAVYMMGGAVYVPGNLTDFSVNPANISAEWNIYIDPLAASEVFESGVPITLVPLDATNLVSAGMADTSQWRAGGRLGDLAAKLYDRLLGGSSTKQMGLWDVMTAEIMLHPKLCDTLPLHLKVITDPGNTYGQTLVLADGKPNVQVCLKPDVTGIKQTLIEAFAGSR